MWINKDYFTQCEVVFSFLKKYNYEKDVTRKKDIGSDVSESFSLYPSTKLEEILRECQLG